VSDNPPGWYPDPANPLQERLWDGSDWVDRLRPRHPVTVSSSDIVGVARKEAFAEWKAASNKQRRVTVAFAAYIVVAVAFTTLPSPWWLVGAAQLGVLGVYVVFKAILRLVRAALGGTQS
jgi:hypothetical protein